MSRFRLLVLLAGCLNFLCPVSALAQQPPADVIGEPPGYRDAIDAAIEEFNARNYEEAREQFAEAHRLFPNARTLRGLGVTGFELRQYPEAVRYLRQALDSQVRPLDAQIRANTEALLRRAEGYMGTVKLELVPASATLLVDGERRDYVAGEPLALPVGDHVFEVRATGWASERRTVKVQGREVQSLHVSLPKLDAAATAVANNERPPGQTPVYKRWWLWTSIGAVVVGGAVAGILIAQRQTRYEARTTENTPSGITGLSPLVRLP